MLLMFAIQGGQFANKDWRRCCVALIGSTAPIPVAARSEIKVCSSSIDGIAGANPAGSMDVCLV